MSKTVILDTDDMKEGEKFNLSLTQNNSAWIEITHIPADLKTYGHNSFNTLFNLHPKERGKIIIENRHQHRETESPRWHASYLNTPKWDRTLESSYMFSGLADSQVQCKVDIPSEFSPFFDYMNQIGNYNQVVAKWYKDGYDFIAYHSDYAYGMPKHTNVAILSLYENANDYRVFSIKAKQNENLSDVSYERVDIKIRHGCILIMCGDTQNKFRHGIPKMDTNSKRVSLTFRYYE